MFSPPDHNRNISLNLSEVLDDIGVNELMVMKRRRMWLISEALENIFQQIRYENYASHFYFGSQTEGSTTLGLWSDIDRLYCHQLTRILQDLSEWEPFKPQLLMVQNDTTYPGYCLLQLVRPHVPLPRNYITDENDQYTDNKGRVLLRHSACRPYVGERHGPAGAVYGGAGKPDIDYVWSLYCSSWPKEANPWLQKQNVSGWPTKDMKRYSSEQGCFVVPIGSRTGMYQDTEWRISTSFAERCLMFNVNITQMRCYILMKMILKTFLKPKCGEAVSSFMCKNILFNCIANSATSSTWNECSLVTCLNQCLQALFNCVLTEQCPHFIIPGNNLLAGKLTKQVKHQLAEVMRTLTENIEQSLLGVNIDDLGERLKAKLSGRIFPYRRLLLLHRECAALSANNNVDWTALTLIYNIRAIQQKYSDDNQSLTNVLHNLCQIYSGGKPFFKVATGLYTPFLCSIIGSSQASLDIQHSKVLSPEALAWLSLGQNSDISSGKLKLASALYCSGDLQGCENTLAALSKEILQWIRLTVCYCHRYNRFPSDHFRMICYSNNEKVLKQNMAFCVAYCHSEVNCITNEMKYEMFRSTKEDRHYRGENDFWMDWAVVDSVPFMYFLQYKVYSQLRKPEYQRMALLKMAVTLDTDLNLGHRETAWNLLGQCMEQEYKFRTALHCYVLSLRVRGRNNAAKWHVCRLLARQFRS